MNPLTQLKAAILPLLITFMLSPVAQAQTNHPPSANAGPDQTVNEFSTVTLDGTLSVDPDGDSITYDWTQVSGTPVAIDNPDSALPRFIAPHEPPLAEETLTFSLTVTDTFGAHSSPDSVNVIVRNIYSPPDCSRAQPTVSMLWPPNHKFQRVSIVGVTDPNPIPVVITVTGVHQDEPVVGTDHTAPDAAIQADGSVLLRAERADSGNGRVYRVAFTAEDGFGGSCSGVVSVCVPITKDGSCIDEGPLYDSTGQ